MLHEKLLDGDHWRIVSKNGKPIHVWKPSGDIRSTILIVHGYYVDTDQAIKQYKLIEQLKASGVRALFIMPEAPRGNGQPVFFPDLDALLDEVQSNIGHSSPSPILAAGHSGAFRTLLRWLSSPRLIHITLLDGLYAGVDAFAKWANQPNHGLTSVVATATPTANSKKLKQKAPSVEVIQVKSGHMALVTDGKTIPEFLRRLNKFAGMGTGALVLALVAGLAYFLFK